MCRPHPASNLSSEVAEEQREAGGGGEGISAIPQVSEECCLREDRWEKSSLISARN